uniref:DIX domain containing 1 n=1 Tax=Anas platyrhynchos platyrhynchos TaxID=8840 RepID=A0A493TRG2_ANAPP
MLACLARGNLLDILQEGFTEQQLQAYVAWVNSQLKKKPTIKPVQDLRQDLRDGVILASLIEIVAGEKLNGVQVNPTSQQEMRENVEKVLQFVASKKIRMHQTSAKDIVDGNLKSIMRLILALAAHFKPGSGRAMNHSAAGVTGKSSSASSASHRPRSAAAVAQGAVAALADVRQDVLQSGRDVFRHRQRNSSMDEEIENPYWSVRALVQQYEGQQNIALESHSSSLASPSPIHSTKSESTVTPSEEKAGYAIIHTEETESKTEETESHFQPDWQAGNPVSHLENSWEEQLLEQQDHLEKEMEEAKKMISGLQALLLNGSLPEDEQEGSFELCEHGACPEEQLDALQQRLAQQDASVLQLKQELLRANMDKEELHNQNVDLQRKVEERNRLLAEYKKELGQKDRHLQQHQTKLDEMLRQLSEASYQQVDLERELEHKEALLAHCMKREAEEVWEALVYTSDCQSDVFKSPSSQRGQAQRGLFVSALTKAGRPYKACSLSKISAVRMRSIFGELRSKILAKLLLDACLLSYAHILERCPAPRHDWPLFSQVFHDDDIIPGWEGKIVAWVEEDHGEN